MAFKKGQRANPNGRPKGSKNKISKPVVDTILETHKKLLERGTDLEACALENPRWFYEHFFKNLIPKNVEITGEDGGPIKTQVEIVFVNSKN